MTLCYRVEYVTRLQVFLMFVTLSPVAVVTLAFAIWWNLTNTIRQHSQKYVKWNWNKCQYVNISKLTNVNVTDDSVILIGICHTFTSLLDVCHFVNCWWNLTNTITQHSNMSICHYIKIDKCQRYRWQCDTDWNMPHVHKSFDVFHSVNCSCFYFVICHLVESDLPSMSHLERFLPSSHFQ